MNTSIEALISEFEHEAAATGRLLERMPADRLPWRPHPKSMTLGALGLHVATIPAGMAQLLGGAGVEAAAVLPHPEPASLEEIRQAWQDTTATFRENVTLAQDSSDSWSVTRQGKPVLTIPKHVGRRLLMLNHWYHHRGQLTVYLRLLDVPLPAVYAASADENFI
jgi:uncharacterized damage-inducible protein DinB